MTRKNNSGFSLIELLVYLCLFAMLIMISSLSLRTFRDDAKLSNAVRTVVSALNSARYLALDRYYRIRVVQSGKAIFLQRKKDGVWIPFRKYSVNQSISIDFNNRPVFSPMGSVAPLCSIIISNHQKSYKTTLSMGGRIKTVQIK